MRGEVPGFAPALVRSATLLRPDVQTFDAMLEGWRAQQLARGLNADTIKARAAVVRRFQAFTNEFPWR